MNAWRPEGWQNPWKAPLDLSAGQEKQFTLPDIFEAGADAMLEAIHEKGQFGQCVTSYFTLADHGTRIYTIQVKTRSQFKDTQRVDVGDDGILVFIPFRH